MLKEAAYNFRQYFTTFHTRRRNLVFSDCNVRSLAASSLYPTKPRQYSVSDIIFCSLIIIHSHHDSHHMLHVSAGALLAMAALQQESAPGVMCLRSVNPYVAAALSDWQGRAGHSPLVPRATAAPPNLHDFKSIAGGFNYCA